MKSHVKKYEIHSPTLASILMVEQVLEKNKQLGKYQLWTKLPRKMMYQTLQIILDYLENSEKISVTGSKVKIIEKERPACMENFPSYLT